MPTPTIPDGKLFFNATLWTGDGVGSQSISNGAPGQSFQPDLVWMKGRNLSAQNNVLVDSVRGTNQTLVSNLTDAQAALSSIAGFNSNGFLTSGTANNGYSGSVSGLNYVGWQWKAGGAAVTNTAGTISSQVSANTTSGFSVVTYTGNGSGTASVGHGLGVSPSMVIVKNRTSGSTFWPTYHGSIPSLYLVLNGTDAGASGQWISVSSSLVSFSTLSSWTNSNGSNYVAYCWAPVAGYSAFGSYTGNGSADGPFVYLGFRPRYIMWKRSDSTGDWIIFDTARDTFNYADKQLVANTSGAEAVTGGGFVRMDFLSNGFKIRSTDSYINASGGTYIYACFAENPFKYANAR
jgi:hypothetical protein